MPEVGQAAGQGGQAMDLHLELVAAVVEDEAVPEGEEPAAAEGALPGETGAEGETPTDEDRERDGRAIDATLVE